ncbi:carboxylesterase [Vibrio ichthyoenteri ATCC 700023]|uniref:Carboxylesterase n=1 Tax=Vibrio ichthyoenteri ATCC 700023 TaxID=870968 RepID=F9S736_9VIBR|nr:alpha/beta fold hydrolase [Vibrio ichthyoenteri]EGU32016.1 carboxylesterase [Vibrio ichthyoenteri ATCC 700023]
MRTILALLLPFITVACASNATHPLYTPSNIEPVTTYASFDDYAKQTKQQLLKHRYFLTQDKNAELLANLPVELKPEGDSKADKGVLLIHGLGDSPYSFVDIAQSLQQEGFLVRTVLLTGHGSRPADMLGVDYQQWNELVEKQVALLKKEVNQIYLGGFSTGGNLAYSYAAKDQDIEGLMLFSPGFVSNEPLAFTTPWISWIKPWLIDVEPDNVTNYTRYFMVPTNGFAQYYHTSKQVTDILEEQPYTKPVFMVLTEHDSVLDTQAIKSLFETQFIHPNNKLIWFGSQPTSTQENIRYINSQNPELRISNMSHMGILYAPENPYYGLNGSERICRNGSEMTDDEIKRCNAGEEVWYSAWDGRANEHIHARLTFNPWYSEMIESLNETFDVTDAR